MTNEQFAELLLEVRAIRMTLTQGKPAAAAVASKPAPTGPKDIPLPSEVIENAGDVAVHFGKNKGTPLSALSAKSVEWYAQEPEPRLRTDGTPFPPRPEDVLLRNAARTIVHRNRGTLPSPPVKLESAAPISEDVPF
jgi:hypothetical protein